LGDVCPDSSPHRQSWRNILSEREIPWLRGHQLQGRTVFPAAGYVSTLLEAAQQLPKAGEEKNIRLIEILDFHIHQAMSFDEDDSGIEILITLEDIKRDEARQVIKARFTYSSAVGKEANTLSLMASATIEVFLGEASTELLPAQESKPANLVDVTEDRFYGFLGDLGYGSKLTRKLGKAIANVGIPSFSPDEGGALLAHPGTLDCAIQAVILAFCHPNDGQLWSLHVPTVIKLIRVNPAVCGAAWSEAGSVNITAATIIPDGPGLLGDADIFGAGDSAHAAVQIEGVRAVPFAGATAADDDKIFARMRWANINSDGEEMTQNCVEPPADKALALAAERTAIYYLR
jgi:hybrid polyketide synthase/nonribosomal peptide synthetase ACE1